MKSSNFYECCVFSALLLSRFLTQQWSIYRARGAILVGLVVISSAADNFDIWAAFLLGFLAGMVYIGAR